MLVHLTNQQFSIYSFISVAVQHQLVLVPMDNMDISTCNLTTPKNKINYRDNVYIHFSWSKALVLININADMCIKTRHPYLAETYAWNRRNTLRTHFCPLDSFCTASFDTTWPQTSFIGGLFSLVCWRKMGHAKMEWNLESCPRSIST